MKKTWMFLWICFFHQHLIAFTHNGRLSFGAYSSKETLAQKVGDSPTAQEYSATSQRLVYQMSDFGLGPFWDFSTDLRNEYDFFDALNVEMKSFESRNRAQARLAFLKYDRLSDGLYFQFGRYNIRELGSSFNDGVHIGYRFLKEHRIGGFAGFNPRALDRSHLQIQSRNKNYGIYYDYQSTKETPHPLEFTLGVTEEIYEQDFKRKYLYETFTKRWENKWLYSLAYIDFHQRTQISNGQLQWTHHIVPTFQYRVSALAFDVINYRLNQDLREKLAPNPYREAQAQFDFFSSKRSRVSLNHRLGERDVDGLKRQRHTLSWQPNPMAKGFFEFWMRAEYRREFTKEGFFGGASANFHMDQSDWTVSIDKGSERQTQGFRLNPLLVDGTYNFYIQQTLFGGLSLQFAKDEQAQIISAFFNIVYRFGDRAIARPQSPAPVRGAY